MKRKLRGQPGEIFSHLPFDADKKEGHEAADGVTCSVCHQIGKEKLGTRESFNGGFVVDAPKSKDQHPEYGPFEIESGQKRIMQTSSGGFRPSGRLAHPRLRIVRHVPYAFHRGSGTRRQDAIGELPEQMPYLEWLHSDYRDKQSCQDVPHAGGREHVPITKVLGVPREGCTGTCSWPRISLC